MWLMGRPSGADRGRPGEQRDAGPRPAGSILSRPSRARTFPAVIGQGENELSERLGRRDAPRTPRGPVPGAP